ncbi:MAG TPA: RNA polymerase subunit sigma-70 [Haliangiales bacterium]|nr:RNA polymerase subunit sigma-70 [Haliangiales bacterium]
MTTNIPDHDLTALIARHRRAVHVHCYRMLGSYSDAEDLVQETALRAWTARERYDPATGEIGLRRWLYRIATNACLDFLKSAPRRVAAQSASFNEVAWLQPYPDRQLDEEAVAKETIALGYLALIQLLPAQQRAVYLCRELLGWSAAETAELLDVSVAAANSALQRARETMAKHAGPIAPSAPTAAERAVLAAFIDAHQRRDTDAAFALLREDIRATMPPAPALFVGRDAIRPLLARAFESGMGEWRLVEAWANRQPAAVSYLRAPGDSKFRAFKLDVLRIADDRVAEITTFEPRDVDAFGLPEVLP